MCIKARRGTSSPTSAKAVVVLVVLALLTALAACAQSAEQQRKPGKSEGSAGGPTTAAKKEPAYDPGELADTEWTLVSLNGHGLVKDSIITLDFDDGVGGNAGCNEYGTFELETDGGVFKLGNMMSTQTGCWRDVGRQETTYIRTLEKAATYQKQGDRLEIRNAAGEITLVYAQKPQYHSDPAELVGTKWVLRSINGVRPVEGSTPTISFESEKEVAWYDGCQNFSGHYYATENDLTVPEYGIVGGDCMKPEAYEDTDGTCVVACFGPEGDYLLKDGLLEIRSETGESTSVLEPLAKGAEPEQKGTPWALRGFVEGGKTTPVSGEAGITLTFDRGTLRRTGEMFGSTGCNDYSVAYEHPIARNGPDRLNLAEPVVTKRGCPGSRGLLEQRFLGILRDVSYYPAIFADGRMRLDTADGRKLVFRAPD